MIGWISTLSERDQIRLVLAVLATMPVTLTVMTNQSIQMVDEARVWAGSIMVCLNLLFCGLGTLYAFAPKMGYKLRLACLFIGAAVSLPLAFAGIYALIQALTETCLVVGSSAFELDPQIYRYFSFTTFTTLGYGEITPRGICRDVTSLEAILGMVYIGLFISVLVERNSGSKPKNGDAHDH